MTDHPAPIPPPRPWYRRGWRVVYLVALIITLVVGTIQTAIPAGSGIYASLGKQLGLTPVGVALDVLLIIPIGIWVFRRRLGRPKDQVFDLLLNLALFSLAVGAVVAFVFFTCAAVSGI